MIINSEVVSINGGENQLICHLAQGSGKAERRCYRERCACCCGSIV